jgi:hypothetical protein
MTHELRQFERVVDREMALLRELPTLTPRPGVLDRVKTAVRTEAGRASWSIAGFHTLPRWAAVAAAILMAVGLSGVLTGPFTSGEQPADAAELLAVWNHAVATSSDRAAFLLDGGWVLEDVGTENGEAIDGVLDGVESSFNQLGTL